LRPKDGNRQIDRPRREVGEALWIHPNSINANPTDTHYFTDPTLQVNHLTDAVVARIGLNYRLGYAAAPAVYK
jgi:hypothetical protein